MIVSEAFSRSNSQPECEARADVPRLSDIWLDSIRAPNETISRDDLTFIVGKI